MEFRKLGSSNLQVSRVGFGCWPMSGHGYGAADDDKSLRAVQEALDLGINFFDTADVYGFGHSETILSKALGSRRHDVVIATKFGVGWDLQSRTFKDCSSGHVLKALEGSLRRLRIDSIPLYQIHWPDTQTPISETMETLLKCRESGKIQHLGCCNFPLPLIRDATSVCELVSIQVEFGVGRLQNMALLRDCHQSQHMGTIIYGVLGRGIYSGKYDFDSQFGENDTRDRDEQFKGERLIRNLGTVEGLRKIGTLYRRPPAQVAVRWAIESPFVTSAIVGMKNAEQVRDSVEALDWELEPEHFRWLLDLDATGSV